MSDKTSNSANSGHADAHTLAASLVLAFARFSLDTESEEQLSKACEDNTDWDIFSRLVQYHQLEAVFHGCITPHIASLIPESTRHTLQGGHRSNAVSNLYLHAKAAEIFKVFRSRDVPLLLVKGIAVQNWLYRQNETRSSGDIDLFIDVCDLNTAIACMESIGYQTAYLKDRIPAGSRLAKQVTRTQKDIKFIHPKNPAIIELHWQLSENKSAFPITFDQAWRSRCTLSPMGTPIESLSESLHANYLCFHGARHFFIKLFWLYDIAKLMIKPDIDWPTILLQSETLKNQRSMGVTLALASRFFSVPIPEAIKQHPSMIPDGFKLSDDLYRKILSENPGLPSGDDKSPQSVRQEINWYSTIHPSRLQRPAAWIRYAFSPGINEWESLYLPDYLTPFYRIWRPIRLIKEGLKKLIRYQ